MRCPTENEFARFFAGDSTQDESRALEAHGGECPACRDRLERGTDGSLIADVRVALAADHAPDPDPDWFDRALEKALPRYHVLKRIGAGGMGIVYEAEQKSPRRRVAIKVVKNALLTPALEHRFAHEVETLGRLDHPGIAHVFEADTFELHGEHRPFFAMELIEGVRLDHFVDERNLSLERCLELFVEICEAVQHAHQKGVLHRDLKPGNILVTPEGHPKIVDFGVARTIGGRGDTMNTQAGQLIGTLAYMSPEQVAGTPDEVDTRSDVFTLGLILFRILAGRLPYDLDGLSAAETLRIIGDAEHLRLRAAAPSFPEDVETIVSQALDRDPDRRYSSAGALADDLRRFLRHEPIAARPPGRVHALRMFVRRHPGPVLGGIVAAAALILGTAVSLGQAVRARNAESDAVQEARTAERVTEFLQHLLGPADRDGDTRPHDYSIFQALIDAESWIASDLADEPLVEASVRIVVGELHMSRGEHERAASHLERALDLRRIHLPSTDVQVAGAINVLGVLRFETGAVDEAEALFANALDIYSDHPGDVEIEMRVATTLMNLGAIYAARGDLEQADETFARAIVARRAGAGDESPLLIRDLLHVAALRKAQGSDDEELDVLLEALEIYRAAGRPQSLATWAMLHHVADRLQTEGRFEEASDVWREALSAARALLVEGDMQIGLAMNQLAVCLVNAGRLEEAAAVGVEAVAFFREYADGSAELSNMLQILGEIYQLSGDPLAGLELLYEALDLRTELHGPDHELVRTSEAWIEKAEALALEQE